MKFLLRLNLLLVGFLFLNCNREIPTLITGLIVEPVELPKRYSEGFNKYYAVLVYERNSDYGFLHSELKNRSEELKSPVKFSLLWLDDYLTFTARSFKTDQEALTFINKVFGSSSASPPPYFFIIRQDHYAYLLRTEKLGTREINHFISNNKDLMKTFDR
ncbi:MAG: hypothetical protein R2879_16295 [Saprospiraceae bacterium]